VNPAKIEKPRIRNPRKNVEGVKTNSFHTAFEAQMELERSALRCCADHPHGKEGLRAFVEKRKPVFSDKKI